MPEETVEMENKFEKAPENYNVPPEQDFEKSFNESGITPFSGESFGEEKNFGVASESNDFYGEAVSSGVEMTDGEKDGDGTTNEYNRGIADAAALINYGLNAACRELGVETVVQKIKSFDVSGREDPVKDFYEYLGVDTPKELKDVQDEGMAAKPSENEFREDVNAPTQKKSMEGAFEAFQDMKELIAEVEGADPKYEELRQGAKAAGKGYFEYAVSSYGIRGLTELFKVLSKQREKTEEEDDVKDKVVDLSERIDVEGRGDSGTGEEVKETIDEIGQKKNEDGKVVNLEERIRNKERLNPEILEPEQLERDAS